MNSSATSSSPEKAEVRVRADRSAGPPISRFLFGKFTEHLGRNVYGGAWSETIENPWFASITQWPDAEIVRKRLQDLAKLYQIDMKDYSDREIAPYWIPGGAIKTALDRGVRGNAQRITTEGPGAGLRTLTFLPLHGHRGARLTVRGRANKTTRVIVRLLTLRGVELAWADVTLHRGAWQTVERTLRRAPGRSLTSGAPILLDIQLEHPVTVWLDRCSVVPSDNRYGWDAEVVAIMKETRLPMLRFPGGNFVSGYHWKDGVGLPDSRPVLPNPAWPEIEWNDVGTDEWLQLCSMVGCEPLICVNAGNGAAEEAAEWVEYCNGSLDSPMGAFRAANGHPQPYNVRYWEIGNELYGHWQIGHSSAVDYAERYLRFQEAMLAVDPSIQIIANGHNAEWNRTVMERAGETVRSFSVHTLEGYRIPAEADPEKVYLEYMGYAEAYGDHLNRLAAPMKEKGLTPRLAITELSIFTLKQGLPNLDNLSEALYYSGIVNTAIRNSGLVELITHSALINHSGGLVKQRGVVYPHPLWLALQLYSAQPGIKPVEVAAESSSLSCSGEWLTRVDDIPSVDSVALLSEDDRTLVLFLTNRDPRHGADIQIRLEGFARQAEGTVSVLSGDSFMATNAWDAPHRVQTQTRPIQLKDGSMRLSLPPHSVSRIMLEG